MKKIAVLFVLLVFSITAFGQSGFKFDSEARKKVTIPFQFINNLIIVSMEVNGVKLNFLLDTGVDETILFSLDDQEIKLNNVEKIKLKGLGGNEAVEGLKSAHNKASFHGFSDIDHDIYIVLDQEFNFSASIGVPVNGIIGYEFFKNHLVEINYDKKKIIVHRDNEKIRNKIRSNYRSHDITIEDGKPYIVTEITTKKEKVTNAKLLIDSGNTDAVWLFEDKAHLFEFPDKTFDDFLGRGLSGDVLGKRGRIEAFSIDDFTFKMPIAAFPDMNATKNISMSVSRVGSVGAEILKRFNVIFDYPNNKIHLRKGANFYLPFNYNMSGIEVHHEGMSWVKEKVDFESVKNYTVYMNETAGPTKFTYKFELKPIFSIANIRKDSPAELAGLRKGDILVSVNNKSCNKLTLQDINYILKSEEGKTIEIEVNRNTKIMKFYFKLKSII